MSKSLKFAGSGIGEPWWVIGDVTRRLLEPQGYEVEVLSESGSTNNPRYVGGGKADVGACVVQTLSWAIRREHLFKDDDIAPLRAIGRLVRPAWLAAAARWELGFKSLREIGESDFPVRIQTHDLSSIAGVVPNELLKFYNLSKEEVEARGGTVTQIGQGDFRAGDADVIVANLYMGRTAITKHWYSASEHENLRFFDFDEELLDHFAARGEGAPGEIPFHFLRGVDRRVKVLERNLDIIIYVPESADEQFVHDLAKTYDENREMFFNQAFHVVWDPAAVTSTAPLELHPGARRYYEEAGHI